MYISSGQKMAILGVLLAGGGAAFVYFDPLDLDLLGLNPPPAVVQPSPKVMPRTPTPKATPPAAPVGPTATSPAVAQQVAPVTTPVQVETPTLKMSSSLKGTISKPAYPPSVDLRHCLDQPTPQDIAKCAGE